ncbi:hypothetical protein OROHE_012534 [Orobanche hederae]
MASGSLGRASQSGSKTFDFGSDDILCSYEDYVNQDANTGIHTDTKEFNKTRVARSSVFPAATYSTPEESSFNEGVVTTVENTMKKYTDNLMRFLEGISSRLSQLELYCYNLDKSIGEMRSELSRDHGDSESKLKSLERHIEEVHRSVQILRDKQELADTQKELAKLQVAHKESSLIGNEERSSAPSSEAKKGTENPSDGNDQQQLALALPHQVSPPQQPSVAPPQLSSSIPPPQSMAYYSPTTNNNITAPPSQKTPQYLHTPQVQQQDLSRMAPPSQPQLNQQVLQSLPPYQQQQQWGPQQQSQIRTSTQMGLYSYMPPPQSNQSPPTEMQKASLVGASEAIPYGYGANGRPIPPQQHLKTTAYGPQSGGDGYAPSRPHAALQPGNYNNNNAYMVYEGEGGRSHHHLPPHFQQQKAYPPTSQMHNNVNMIVPHSSSSMRSQPYSELIEKLVGMGYRGDHVVAIIQRLDETSQPIDFNSVLDMLNGGGPSQRAWHP